MSGDVSRETESLPENIRAQVSARRAGRRKHVLHGGRLCSCCLEAEPGENDRYCPKCRKTYNARHKREERKEFKRLRAQVGLSKGKDHGTSEEKTG